MSKKHKFENGKCSQCGEAEDVARALNKPCKTKDASSDPLKDIPETWSPKISEDPPEVKKVKLGCGIASLLVAVYFLWVFLGGLYFYMRESSIANSLKLPFRSEECGLGLKVTKSDKFVNELRIYTVCGKYGNGFKAVVIKDGTSMSSIAGKESESQSSKGVSFERLNPYGQTHVAVVKLDKTSGSPPVTLEILRGTGYSTRKKEHIPKWWKDEIELGFDSDGTVNSAKFRSISKPEKK